MYIYIHMQYVYMYVHVYVHMYVRTYVCTYVCTYICVRVCVYIYIYILLPAFHLDLASPLSNLVHGASCAPRVSVHIYVYWNCRSLSWEPKRDDGLRYVWEQSGVEGVIWIVGCQGFLKRRWRTQEEGGRWGGWIFKTQQG